MCRSKFYTWYNRNGNHLIAGLNLLKHAFFENKHCEVILPEHHLFHYIKENMETADYCTCDNILEKTREINPTGGGKLLTIQELKMISDKYISFKLDTPNEPKYDIGIHLRAGDVYGDGRIHFEYVQPPLDFYVQIMEKNKGKSFCFVYEKDNGPIFPKIKEYVEKNNINATFQSSSLTDDLITLCSCETLVFSFGTFCFIPYLFSKCLKNTIMPDILINKKRGSNWFCINEVPANLKVISLPNYILVGYWQNTKEQHGIMLNYKIKETEYEKLMI